MNITLNNIVEYFSDKLKEHGATSRGVDWNGEESHFLRFKQLSKLIDPLKPFSINDLGCGYGALYDFLKTQYTEFEYNGYDICSDMIHSACQRHPEGCDAYFAVAEEPLKKADYSVASGIFNVRLERSNAEWYDYIVQTLDKLHSSSRRGFAFNCLTSYSDSDKMRDYLYYADPCALFDICKRRYSRQVALLHDYGLWEFTITVRMDLP